jgi:hypothetical protein
MADNERRDIDFTVNMPDRLEDVTLAWREFRGPLPEPGPPVRFTIRQRIRIAKYNLRCAIEQWIHDRLHNARCDN